MSICRNVLQEVHAQQTLPHLPGYVSARSQSNPEKYVPAFGGFCSFGVAAEPVWTAHTLGPFGDASKWTISLDGRLHVFRRWVDVAADACCKGADRGTSSLFMALNGLATAAKVKAGF